MTVVNSKIPIPHHGFRLDAENEACEAYMRQVNGRADTYTFDFFDILLLGDDLEKQLEEACISSSHRPGITAVVHSAGPHKSRNTARWAARGEGTEAHFRRYKDGWRLMEAKRIPVFGGQTRQCRIAISRRDYTAIQRRAVSQFIVQE
ncbi:hypothetical protein GFL58_30890 [Rhizobium leguminosarum bv. viciae]|uniref:hypothetical protein n=1 Tax=Rhizobium leguminosarum TaxID=384 RepID=UPI00143F1AE0|nr:hypothetical protein [Rhizobium leguminosarum]NKM65325.1 hypothetical protein [Rhizobium leguminosarum bv. viciae]